MDQLVIFINFYSFYSEIECFNSLTVYVMVIHLVRLTRNIIYIFLNFSKRTQ
jgi:hypothetical protein